LIWPASGSDCLYFATASGYNSLRWVKENKVEKFSENLKYFVAQDYNKIMTKDSFKMFIENSYYLNYIKVPWWRKLLDV
jgi:hypothetical protein